MGEEQSLQQMVLAQLIFSLQKKGFGCLRQSMCKTNSKWISDLNAKGKTIKLLEKTWGETTLNLAMDS